MDRALSFSLAGVLVAAAVLAQPPRAAGEEGGSRLVSIRLHTVEPGAGGLQVHVKIRSDGKGRGFVTRVRPASGGKPPSTRKYEVTLSGDEVKRFAQLLAIYDFFDIDAAGLQGGNFVEVILFSGKRKRIAFDHTGDHDALGPVCQWILEKARAAIARGKPPSPKAMPRRRLARTLAFPGNRPGYPRPGAPLRAEDPVPGPSRSEISRVLAGIDDDACAALVEGLVNRAEHAYLALVDQARVPRGLVRWLRANPSLRRIFWLALSPCYDHPLEAMGVLDALRREDAARVLEYPHLAVALAVVRDAEDAVYTSRYYTLWAVRPSQFKPSPGALAAFRYFTSEANRKEFATDVAHLAWPVAVHLADFDVNGQEADWARRRFAGSKDALGSLYHKVAYDHGKANTGKTKLGDRPYTLQNLLAHGGVCVDQAHFCSRVCKSLGVPAMKAAGENRYGGAGHAFTCIFRRKGGALSIESTGRYRHDFYYTGEIFDPQTRTLVLDRTLAMMLDGASLSYEKYETSMALVRMAEKVFASEPGAALALTKKALTLNWFNGPGWRLLMRFVAAGIVGPAEGVRWANEMMKHLRSHPDLTLQCFQTFLECIPRADVKRRQAFYGQALRLYGERPDLQISLARTQGLELARCGRPGAAVSVMFAAASKHAKEGRILLPLLRDAVRIATTGKMEKQALPYVRRVLEGFPKKRGDAPSQAYADLRDIVAPVLLAGR